MGSKRVAQITRSIYQALLRDPHRDHRKTIITYFLAFFTIWRITLVRLAADLFRQLRNDVWKINEDDYKRSFQSHKGQGRLEPMGDLGYSGSVSYAIHSICWRFH
jgi:hypothetical protein